MHNEDTFNKLLNINAKMYDIISMLTEVVFTNNDKSLLYREKETLLKVLLNLEKEKEKFSEILLHQIEEEIDNLDD